MLNAQGASFGPTALVICPSQDRNSSLVRAFGPGNDPITPALQAAITVSGPETRNIGAAIAGSRNLDFILCRRDSMSY